MLQGTQPTSPGRVGQVGGHHHQGVAHAGALTAHVKGPVEQAPQGVAPVEGNTRFQLFRTAFF